MTPETVLQLGRNALEVAWDEGPLAGLDSKTQREQYAELARMPGAVARKEGDAAAALPPTNGIAVAASRSERREKRMLVSCGLACVRVYRGRGTREAANRCTLVLLGADRGVGSA